MKFFSMLMLLTALVACSSTSSKKENDSDSEEGQISSKEGAPLIYYKEGDLIVIRSCDNASEVNLKDPKIARAKCKGKENRVTIETFKQVLNKIIADKAAEKAKNEAKAAAGAAGGTPPAAGAGAPPAGPVKSAQEKLEDAQIEKQLQFIETYNQDKAALLDLRSTQIKGVFNQKLKDQLNKTVNNVMNQGQNFASDPDDIIYSVLMSLDPNKKKPCGLDGSVEERIKSCASTPGATLNGWKLVLRTKSDREIWYEKTSGLVWGGMLGTTHDHIDAVGQCSQGREENGDLDPSVFRFPTIEEFSRSAFNSDGNPLKSKDYKYWSSTSEGPEVWVYDGSTGKKKLTSRTVVTKDKQNNEFSSLLKLNVRCVGKVK